MAYDANVLYDYIKIRFKTDGNRRQQSGVPEQTWKDFKRQWIVLSANLSPYDCYIVYCTKEQDWLADRSTLQKLLLRKYNLIRHDMSVEKNKDHLEIEFDDYSIIMHFKSHSKQQQWYDELHQIRCRFYAELVRCPEHPHKEGEYVVEICSDKLKLWDPLRKTVSVEWKLHSVRRAQYHNRTGKVEIEVGRAAETGEGHFYFIGHEVKDFFYKLKDSISLLSKVTSMKQNPPRRSVLDSIASTDEDSTGDTDDGSNGTDRANTLSPQYPNSCVPPPPPHPPPLQNHPLSPNPPPPPHPPPLQNHLFPPNPPPPPHPPPLQNHPLSPNPPPLQNHLFPPNPPPPPHPPPLQNHPLSPNPPLPQKQPLLPHPSPLQNRPLPPNPPPPLNRPLPPNPPSPFQKCNSFPQTVEDELPPAARGSLSLMEEVLIRKASLRTNRDGTYQKLIPRTRTSIEQYEDRR